MGAAVMMILYDIDGYAIWVDPSDISAVAQINGLRTKSMVYMRSGHKFEVREEASQIQAGIADAMSKAMP